MELGWGGQNPESDLGDCLGQSCGQNVMACLNGARVALGAVRGLQSPEAGSLGGKSIQRLVCGGGEALGTKRKSSFCVPC